MPTVAIAGDTMLGRLCAPIAEGGDLSALFDEGVRAAIDAADLTIANLECCISDRGERWPDPRKPFFFRAPPRAAGLLAELGVDVVSLANNHALDYGSEALLDTIEHCTAAGIAVVGAGPEVETARAPVTVDAGGRSVCVVPVADHPVDFAASPSRPGIAFADLSAEVPPWLTGHVAIGARAADIVVVTAHWGPNMVTEPLPHVVAAADELADAGATLIAGHSAHVFHGVEWKESACVIYDSGDFLDDYAVDPVLRNDLGVLWTVHLDSGQPSAVEALPLHLDTCRTTVADHDDAEWVARRLEEACAPCGTAVTRAGGRLLCRPR